MDVFIARQPILDADQKVFGYELLYRAGPENIFPGIDADAASSQTIHDSVATFGLDALAPMKLAFVNVARRVLTEHLYSILPTQRVVLELLETVKPDAEVVEACKELKRSGYLLALDDYVEDADYAPLIEMADFIKVDFLTTSTAKRQELVTLYGSRVHLLAEKVETVEEFREGMRLGFEYFQGFYFCTPEMISRKEIPAFKLNYLQLIQEVSRLELDFDRLEEIIKGDVSLSVRLLRMLNSAAFGYKGRVRSVKGALTLLGEATVKKWATMLAIGELGEDKPAELVVTCLVRARVRAPGSAGLASWTRPRPVPGRTALTGGRARRPASHRARARDGAVRGDQSGHPGRRIPAGTRSRPGARTREGRLGPGIVAGDGARSARELNRGAAPGRSGVAPASLPHPVPDLEAAQLLFETDRPRPGAHFAEQALGDAKLSLPCTPVPCCAG